LICTFAFVAFTTPSHAEPARHGAHQTRNHHGSHARHKAVARAGHRTHRRSARRHHRAHQHRPRRQHAQAAQIANFRNANASLIQPQTGFSGSRLVAEARRYIGGNPTGRSSLWCARFMNMVLERSGHRGTGSDMARSFASYGRRLSGPQVGAIAVISRGRRGGHVGVVSGVDAKGNPIIVSGNHGRRVAEASYPKGSVYAYVAPN
jgi:uncharacterized protein (TIGR02594 family)